VSPARVAQVSPARACAYTVVRRVFEQGAYADRALGAEAAGLQPRDRALAMQIAYGTVQRRGTLDHLAQRLVRRPLDELEPAVLAALWIGLFQLLYLDRVAAHAAVDESVELAKHESRGGAGLVNAVLRRAAQQGSALLGGLDDRGPAEAAVMHSVPEWLARLWWSELGAERARALLRRINEPAESALRVNLLISTVAKVTSQLPVPSHPAPVLPEGIVLDGPFDAHGSKLWSSGAIMPQSRGSMLVARVLAPTCGDRVLDLCAAPGGKSTHLAALMGDREEVVAVERHPGRARALEQTARRMHCGCVRVVVQDAACGNAGGEFDRVLVDPPCSGLGTLQSRPDLRWRATPEAISELASLQARIIASGAGATRPGGTLVYSVCTLSRQEGQEVIDGFLRARPDFDADDLAAEYPGWGDPSGGRHLQLLPDRDGTEGFFIARLRRSGPSPRLGALRGRRSAR
jgi:16S rRNA (cytosine967-C5)-methyltransferase